MGYRIIGAFLIRPNLSAPVEKTETERGIGREVRMTNTTDVLITITSKGTEFVVFVTFEGTKTADFVTFKGIFCYICNLKLFVMIDLQLIAYMKEELANTPVEFRRYMYDRIIWDDRLVGLVGPRGVGKSTMVKQYILAHDDQDKWLYASADHSYFATHTLIALANEAVKEGITHLVLDEIHKYANWSRELKEIYDVHQSLQVIFTGSSVLDIMKGQADLSRRALIFEMQGLSFREFLSLYHGIDLKRYTLDEIIAHKVEIPANYHPLPHFREYLRYGYYPFNSADTYAIRLQQVMAYTMEVDIPQYAGMNVSTTRKLKQLMAIISQSAPVKPSVQNLGSELKVSKNDVPDYLLYLEKAGMLAQVRDDTGGLRGLGKVEKVFLDNTNLMYAISRGEPNIGNVRETFFNNQMRVNNDVMTSRASDFTIGDYTFEVGGSHKGKRQLEGVEHGIVVRDDIEFGHSQFIPLWHFGLNY